MVVTTGFSMFPPELWVRVTHEQGRVRPGYVLGSGQDALEREALALEADGGLSHDVEV